MKDRDVILDDIKSQMKNRDIMLQNMSNDIKEIKEEQRNLSKSIAKIEIEHGEKLQILLDVVTSQEEKNKEFMGRFEEHEKILNKHSDEIYYLKIKTNKRKPIL